MLEPSTRKKKVSELFAIIATSLVILYIADVLAAGNGNGFLPISPEQRGISLGAGAATLFFISFGIGFRVKSSLTTALLIAGGGLLVSFMLLAPRLGLLLYLVYVLQSVYILSIAIGCIITGLGVFRAIRK